MIQLPRIIVPDDPLEADRAVILSGLAAYNRHHAEPGTTGHLAVLLANDAGTTVGGLWGSTLFDWLNIELVFVPRLARGAGLGSSVMRHAEAAAKARGCIGASLDTYSFQARGFYERLGYILVGTVPDCPPGGARHFLQKRFSTAS